MKKTVLFALFALFFTLNAVAIQPLPRPFTDRQSDGTTITVRAHGDGHVAFYTTTDDQILVRNAQGDLCYAVFMGSQLVPSAFIAHNPGQRSAAEIEFLNNDETRAQRTKLNNIARRRAPFGPKKAIGTSTADGLGHYNISASGAVKSIGNYTIPVIMVQFKDVKFKSTTTVEKMSRYYNEEGYHDEEGCVGSVRDYFKAQSHGMFVPTFDVVGIVTLDYGVEHYGGNVNYYGESYDAYLLDNYSLISEAVAKASASVAKGGLGVNFSKYNDGNGVPLVTVLFAGKGEATEDQTSANEKYIWPCELDVDSYFSSVKFRSFFVGNELYTGGRELMGIGVFCHEFGHALGLPDFYCTNYNYSNDDGMSNWSIMDTGAYVNDARAPIGYNAYERSYMGWLDIPDIDDFVDPVTGKLTLADPNADEGTSAVRISTSDSKQYYILENRQPGTWYPSSMGSGMLVTRVAFNSDAWSNNTLNNTQNRQRMKVLTANGAKMYYSGEPANLYGNGVNTIESLTAYNGTTFTLTPAITKITKNYTDKTITFNYGEPEVDINEWGMFRRVKSDEEIVEGKRYLIVYEQTKSTGQVFAGVTGDGAYTFGSKVEMEIDGTYIDNTAYKACPVVLEKAESGNWLIKAKGSYLCYDKTAASGSNYLYVANSAAADGTEWVITSTSIQSAFNTNRYLQYNTTASRFCCYRNSQKNVVLYKEMDHETIDVPMGEVGYSTLYYGDRNLVVPEDVSAYTYWFNNNGDFEASYIYETGDVIPAGTAVVLQGKADQPYLFPVTQREGDVDTDNILRGTDTETLTTGGDQYFMLSLQQGSTAPETVGFYWGAEEGAAFVNGAHRAYLALSNEVVGEARGFLLNGEIYTTGISISDIRSGSTSLDAEPVYDLQGRRVTTTLLRPGIYVRGGKKFVVR